MEITNFAPVKDVRLNSDGIGMAEYGDDAGLIVRFFLHPHLNQQKSAAAGRQIFEDREYIEIQFPGDSKRTICRPIRRSWRRGVPPDIERFPRQWARYQNQTQEIHEGTPIEEWGPLSKSLALTYKAMNIHTVEQLASVPDSALGDMGHGARTLRDKAQAWIESTKDSAAIQKYAAENQHLIDEIERLKEQVAELGKPKRRGRPKKNADA